MLFDFVLGLTHHFSLWCVCVFFFIIFYRFILALTFLYVGLKGFFFQYTPTHSTLLNMMRKYK